MLNGIYAKILTILYPQSDNFTPIFDSFLCLCVYVFLFLIEWVKALHSFRTGNGIIITIIILRELNVSELVKWT